MGRKQEISNLTILGVIVSIIITSAGDFSLQALPVPIASQYASGVMERVIATRQAGRVSYPLPPVLPRVDGYIAAPECTQIGQIVYLRPRGTIRWERFLVVDCAGADAYSWMRRNNIVAEIDYGTAVRWKTVGRAIGVEEMGID